MWRREKICDGFVMYGHNGGGGGKGRRHRVKVDVAAGRKIGMDDSVRVIDHDLLRWRCMRTMRPLLVHRAGKMIQTQLAYGAVAFVCANRIGIGTSCGINIML